MPIIGYFCAALFAVYCIQLIRAFYFYKTRPAPAGPDATPWVLGIIHSVLLKGIVIIGLLLLYFQYYTIAFFIAIAPIVFVLTQYIPKVVRTLYANTPSFKKVPPLTLYIRNTTDKNVHLKLECFFGLKSESVMRLFTSFSYHVEPLQHSEINFSRYETRMLAIKSKSIIVYMYEQQVEQRDGNTFIRDLQPCFYFYHEKIEAFRSGEYVITINDFKK